MRDEQTHYLTFPYPNFAEPFPASILDGRRERDHIVFICDSDLHMSCAQMKGQKLTVLGILGFIRKISLTTASRYGSSSI